MKTSPRPSTGRATPLRNQDEAARDLFDQFFTAQPGEQELSGILLLVDIQRVRPRESQPRAHFDDEKLAELAQDIAALRARGGGVGGTGILQPITVAVGDPQQKEQDAQPATESRPDPLSTLGAKAPSASPQSTFFVVAGERRYRAALRAGCSQLPVLVREMAPGEGDNELWEDALRENIQRENLAPLEEALAIQRLMQRGGHSVRGMAQRLGKGKGYVEQRLALARARADIQEMVSRRQDTLSVAREIDKVTRPDQRQRLIELALNGISVVKLREQIEQERGKQEQITSVPKIVEEKSRPQPSGQPLSNGSSQLEPVARIPEHSVEAASVDPDVNASSETVAESVSLQNTSLQAALQAMSVLVQETQDMLTTTPTPILSERERRKAAEQIRSTEEALAALKTALQLLQSPPLDQ